MKSDELMRPIYGPEGKRPGSVKAKLGVDDNGHSASAKSAPVTWDGTKANKPMHTDAPLTKARVLGLAKEQSAKWSSRSVMADEEDFMDSKVAYRLLADQAKLFASLIERIK